MPWKDRTATGDDTMADEGHDGADGGPESHKEVPPGGTPSPPHGKDNSFAHVVWIVLAILVLGMILSSFGDCTGNCVSDVVR